MRRLHRRGAAWNAALCCVLLGVLVPPVVCLGAVVGSRHDFSGLASLPPNVGVCTPCHLPHAGQSRRLWSRDLANEIITFNQTADPDYIPKGTLLCYDCHDDMVTGIPVDPPEAVWTEGREPQDVAFSTTTADATRWKSTVGYYERADGTLPTGLPGGGPVDGSATGGHYWKSEPGGSADPGGRGDKIACSLCHDPHKTRTGGNDVFFLTSTTDYNGGPPLSLQTLETNHFASTNTREPTVGGTGRSMCAECHSYADQGDPLKIATIDLPNPPAGVAQHYKDNATPCTNCHKHGAISVSCTDCHGFPPLLATESYPGGAGAHQRHLDALGAAIFDCAICHGPNPGSATWHNHGNGTVQAAEVDIMGRQDWWDPNGNLATTYYGTNSAEAPQPGYEFQKKGGGDRICANLACHGVPPDVPTGNVGALNWSDDMVDDATGAAGDDIEICSWCHDASPAVLDKDGAGTAYGPVKAPNIMGAGSGTGAWGAVVNGHGHVTGSYEGDAVGESPQTGLPAKPKGCSVCHDATYTGGGPYKGHFDGSYNSAQKRLRDTINEEPLLGLVPAPSGTLSDAACIACHQKTTGIDGGLQVSTHGNAFAGAAEGAFQRQCRSCHEPHGRNWNGTGRNLHMIGAWLDSPTTGTWGATDPGEEARVDSDATGAAPAVAITTADRAVVFTSRTGTNSFDENDGAYDPAADADDLCGACHVAAPTAPPYTGTGTGGGSHAGTASPFEQRGNDCTSCHKHDYDGGVATGDAFAPSGCNGCHGTKPSGETPPGTQNVDWFAGQFWPDGLGTTYADDQRGAHLFHVQTVAARVFGENMTQLMTNATAQNPTLASADKQIVICGFCHADPGASGHFTNDGANPSGADRVDVFQGAAAGDYFSRFTTGTHGTYGRTNYAADDTGGAYAYPTDSCATLVCHNQAATPAAPATGQSPGWNAPPDWTTGIGSTCSNTTCHAAAGPYTNVHDTHVDPAAGRGYDCIQCHADNYDPTDAATLRASLQHQNGSVQMNGTGTPAGVWNSPGTIEGTTGGGNGYYDKDGSAGAGAGDAAFAYKNGSYAVTCYRIYCHGADNTAAIPPDWGGGDTTPVWDNSEALPGGVFCGACHTGNGTGGDTHTNGSLVIASGNHTDHLSAAYGPNFGSTGCVGNATTGCHASHAVTSATHVDGSVTFLNVDGTTPAALAATTACSECHGASTADAKTPANWANGAYLLECLKCHDATDPANSARTGTAGGGIDGPAKSAYWTSAGHGRLTTDTYSPSGRTGAGASCGSCHSAASAHIDGTLATTDRLATAGNALCTGCHDGTVDGAGNKSEARASTHGNRSTTMSASPVSYTAQRAKFELNCVECHDVHGTSNIYMVNADDADGPLVSPRYYGGDTAEDLTTFLFQGSAVVFNAKSTGADYAVTTANANKICQTCHTTTGDGNPSPIYKHNAATTGHAASKCTGCHAHDVDSNYDANSQDGFMPKGDCKQCHDAASPYDPGGGAPLAVGVDLTAWASSGHGNAAFTFDPDGAGELPARAVDCTDCHDIGQPTTNTHLDGTVNSVWENGTVATRNENTAHLEAEYFTRAEPPDLPVGSGTWNVQVTFDNYCWGKCHVGKVIDHRHEVDTSDTDGNHWSVQFGTHASYADGDRGSGIWKPADWTNTSDPENAPFPIDCDLNTTADCSDTDYAVCVSCHDPHGTTVVQGGVLGNFMLRRTWKSPSRLCRGCHP